jgi:hypothetical protein
VNVGVYGVSASANRVGVGGYNLNSGGPAATIPEAKGSTVDSPPTTAIINPYTTPRAATEVAPGVANESFGTKALRVIEAVTGAGLVIDAVHGVEKLVARNNTAAPAAERHEITEPNTRYYYDPTSPKEDRTSLYKTIDPPPSFSPTSYVGAPYGDETNNEREPDVQETGGVRAASHDDVDLGADVGGKRAVNTGVIFTDSVDPREEQGYLKGRPHAQLVGSTGPDGEVFHPRRRSCPFGFISRPAATQCCWDGARSCPCTGTGNRCQTYSRNRRKAAIIRAGSPVT